MGLSGALVNDLSEPASGCKGALFIGEGVPPFPSKVVGITGEFVEMGELLPEFWLQLKMDESSEAPVVNDIFTWVQCLVSYINVLATMDPGFRPELMAYQSMIVRLCQDYGGLRWTATT